MADGCDSRRDDPNIIPDAVLRSAKIKKLYIQRRPLRSTVDKVTAKLSEILKQNSAKKNVNNLENALAGPLRQLREKKDELENFNQQILTSLTEDDNDELLELYETEYQHCEDYSEKLSAIIEETEQVLLLQNKPTVAASSCTDKKDEQSDEQTADNVSSSRKVQDITDVINDPKIKALHRQRRLLREDIIKMANTLEEILRCYEEQDVSGLENDLLVFKKRVEEKKARLESLNERIMEMINSFDYEQIDQICADEHTLCESYHDKIAAMIVQTDAYLKQPRPSTEEISEDMEEQKQKSEVKVRLAEKIRKESRHVRDTNTEIDIFTPLQKKPVAQGEVEKYEIGERNTLTYTDKTIMVLGATGTGKTTFINSMVNYLFEVEASDPVRFKVITQEEEGPESARSVTKKVTAYVLHETILSFRLTVVDTPGYGDTDGINADKHTTGLIKKLFESEDESGIDRLDAIVLVVKASDTRLTAHQKHNFNSVFQLFGKDLAENIMVVATFSDASDPPVKRTLHDQGIRFKSFHKFNNSAFFEGPKSNPREQKAQEFYWDVGQEGFKGFFESLEIMQPKSLSQSAEVLRRREDLENLVHQLRKNVRSGISHLEQMRQEALVLEKFQSQIQANEEFEYIVEDEVVKTVPTPTGRYTTNCTSCNRTCHDTCAYKDDNDKERCVAMENGYCKVCPGKCFWDIHKNLPYLYVVEKVEVRKTHEDLRQKYAKAKDEKTDKEALMENLAQQFGGKQKEVVDILRGINGAIDKLHQIAHCPRFMTDVEYIENLIAAERAELKPGYEERIAHLKYQKDLATIMEQAQDPNFDPFDEYRNGKWSKFIEDFNKNYYQQKSKRMENQSRWAYSKKPQSNKKKQWYRFW